MCGDNFKGVKNLFKILFIYLKLTNVALKILEAGFPLKKLTD